MTVEILSIGTELLLGDIVNTNSAYLARELAALGFPHYHQVVVGDNPERLREALALSLSRSDIVITTGGLGPTYDDLTKETVAAYFGLEMALYTPSLKRMDCYFKASHRPMSENNIKQAYMPTGGRVLPNDRGTADGVIVEGQGKRVILLPGPPREMTAMFQQQVVPYLKALSSQVLVSHRLHFYGIGEAQLEQELHEYMLRHLNPTIAPYASMGQVTLRVTGRGGTTQEAEEVIAPVLSELVRDFGGYIYSLDGGSLEVELVQLLAKEGKKIATAESCTGGLVSQRITSVPGSSQVFDLGVCSYANQMKENLLGVKEETLKAHGAVSKETALEMAEGIRLVSGADLGLSTTGIAGPDGGSEDKPVGLVYIAISTAAGSWVEELHLNRGYGGGREHIRALAASAVLHMALKNLRPEFKLG